MAKQPATFAGNGYDAMNLMIAAIKKGGSDSGKIRDAIESTKDFIGVTAVYTYSPTDHFGAQASSVTLAFRQGRKVRDREVSGKATRPLLRPRRSP